MAIDPTTFPYEESRAMDIYKALERNDIKVFFPSQPVGDCLFPYVIVKNDGSYKHAKMSTDRDMYSLQCYVPRDRYSELEPLVQKVKRVITKELYPMIRPYGQQMPSYYDQDIKAHYVSVEFENYKKIIGGCINVSYD